MKNNSDILRELEYVVRVQFTTMAPTKSESHSRICRFHHCKIKQRLKFIFTLCSSSLVSKKTAQLKGTHLIFFLRFSCSLINELSLVNNTKDEMPSLLIYRQIQFITLNQENGCINVGLLPTTIRKQKVPDFS